MHLVIQTKQTKKADYLNATNLLSCIIPYKEEKSIKIADCLL